MAAFAVARLFTAAAAVSYAELALVAAVSAFVAAVAAVLYADSLSL